jgi:outer membrane lipoprotein-sorting protein
VRSKGACADLREELSARLDGEVDASTERLLEEHLATCAECRRYEAALSEARRALRTRPAEAVPDLKPRIMDAIEAEVPRLHRRTEWKARVRVAAIAAAASALLLFGASLPLGERTADVALATEIVQRVRAAGRMLDSYSATYKVVERNWHSDIRARRFQVQVAFRAPERFSLSIVDRTSYPTQEWPRNDVRLVSSGRRWWIEEPSTCPVQALPGCREGGAERRSLASRQPFDGTSLLPTDIIVPLQTIGGSVGLDVVRETSVLGRKARTVELPYGQAAPLIESLQPGGSWRAFHPFDRVEIALDTETWFPLGFTVEAGSGAERAAWAQRGGYADRPGQTILQATISNLSVEEPDPFSFKVPRSGGLKDGGFKATRPSGPEPRYVAGLRPHRSGRAGRSTIRSYSDGLTWLKVVSERSDKRSTARFFTSEQVELHEGGVGYYTPSSLRSARRVDLFAKGMHIALESNLERAELLRVAGSIEIRTRALPRNVRAAGGLILSRLDLEGFDPPDHLPEGYRPAAVLRSLSPDGRVTETTYYRRDESEHDGFGIRIVRTEPEERLSPPSAEFIEVAVGDVTGRWSTQRGELEWIEGGVYRAVAAPSFDLGTVVRIARGLR